MDRPEAGRGELSPVSGELEPEGGETGGVVRPGPGDQERGRVGHRPPGVQHQGVGLVWHQVRVETAELDQQHTGTNQSQLLQQKYDRKRKWTKVT